MPEAYPEVQGRCPACGGASLFLGDGGYVTCSRIDCPDPEAATRILERRIDYSKIRVIGVGPETVKLDSPAMPAALRGPNWKAQP
ncbi:DUF6085 family protein [Streptomyces sp. H27-H1]|uniref:DUF6085 family protein n=1 Tax=Streptomyces sp. H27-H1 TaxID=2996461 RepID=UPI002270A558|nr:DUF6085 family protein [Streptomyces sp. H27-H1]MCY0928343.1 DUF6085 family protein [Streptomyces sp. H27-H1]